MGQRGVSFAEEPVHRVVLTRDYWLGKCPVTQEQFVIWRDSKAYDEWFRENKERTDSAESHGNHFSDRSGLPAENVTWWEAVEFCHWIREACVRGLDDHGVSALPHVRLPTEAEWEYACRGAIGEKGKLVITETDYWNGDGEAALAEVGRFVGNSDGKTHPVGGKPGNGFGLHDMYGNVWEWCLDAWDGAVYRKRTDGAEDPFVPGSEDANRVLRGGSWFITAWWCRSAFRNWGRPGFRFWFRGFRLGLFPGPVPCPFGKQQQAESASGGGSEGTEWKPEEAGGAFERARFPNVDELRTNKIR